MGCAQADTPPPPPLCRIRCCWGLQMVEAMWPAVIARIFEQGLAQAAIGAPSLVTHEDILLSFVAQSRKGR